MFGGLFVFALLAGSAFSLDKRAVDTSNTTCLIGKPSYSCYAGKTSDRCLFAYSCHSARGSCKNVRISMDVHHKWLGCLDEISCTGQCPDIRFALLPDNAYALLPFDWVVSADVDLSGPWTLNTLPAQIPGVAWYNPAGVSYNGPSGSCPSASRILGTFAGINIASTVLVLLFGNRSLLHHISCGIVGKHAKARSVLYMWIPPLACQFGANIVISLLVLRHAGFAGRFKLIDLALFLTTRPRLSFLSLGLAAIVCRRSRWEPPVYERNIGYTARSTQRTADSEIHQNRPKDDVVTQINQVESTKFSPYTISATSAMIAEIILQMVAAYYVGKTVYYGATNQYYISGALPGYWATHARNMYASALAWLILTPLVLIYLFCKAVSGLCVSRQGSSRTAVFEGRILPVAVVGYSLTTFILSWIFWASFVETAQDLYCPPNLSTQAGLWVAASAIGALLGGGL